MKTTLMILISFGVVLSLSGCDDEAKQKEVDRKQKQERFKKPVDTSGANAITKLPF